MKKIQLRKIVILLALGVAPSMYASELSMMPFGVEHPVRVDITSFTNPSQVIDMGFTSADDDHCGPQVAVSYSGGIAFALPSTGAIYFNGHLPRYAEDLCLATTGGTIALDGITTNRGACTITSGCYYYTCNFVGPGASITSITPKDPFKATCP